MMAVTRANPLLAFIAVLAAAIAYYGVLGWLAAELGPPRPIPETMHVALDLTLLYVVPVAICGSMQFVLTKRVPAQQWWRILQVVVASLLGPFIGASAVLML